MAKVEAFAAHLHSLLIAEAVVDDGWADERVQVALTRLNHALDARFRATVLWMRHATALTVPGGHIYVGRELLSRGLSVDGVAFVLAHEMAHHRLGHLEAAEAMIEAESGVDALAARARQWMSARSEERELAADRVALRSMVKAGFRRRGALECLELLLRVQRDHRAPGAEDDASESQAWLRSFARTHPPTERRIRAIERVVASLPPAMPLSEHARVDAFSVCAPCLARFAGPTCPRCGDPAIDARARAHRARTSVVQARARATVGDRVIRAADTADTVFTSTFAALALLPFAMVGGGGIGLAVAGWAALGIHATRQLMGPAAKTSRAPGDAERLAVLTRAAAWRAPTTFRGRVRELARVLFSPLSGARAVAVRLSGRLGASDVDDALAVDFAIVTDDGKTIEVPHAALSLALPMPRATIGSWSPALRDFARARALPESGVVELSECLLGEGREVQVTGELAGDASVYRSPILRLAEGALVEPV